ncbi:MAG: hypothetical protein J3K34DRAFT_424432 [Monoraphidium minutum]|nr:MAG: hypothetical protein J3K34DRAFT_424432 [Monoraphidium minutum]
MGPAIRFLPGQGARRAGSAARTRPQQRRPARSRAPTPTRAPGAAACCPPARHAPRAPTTGGRRAAAGGEPWREGLRAALAAGRAPRPAGPGACMASGSAGGAPRAPQATLRAVQGKVRRWDSKKRGPGARKRPSHGGPHAPHESVAPARRGGRVPRRAAARGPWFCFAFLSTAGTTTGVRPAARRSQFSQRTRRRICVRGSSGVWSVEVAMPGHCPAGAPARAPSPPGLGLGLQKSGWVAA